MLPGETLEILKREIDADRAPLHDLRDEETIIDRANSFSFDELAGLNFFNEKLACNFIEKRDAKPFETLEDVEDAISHGFSTNFKTRVLSILEANVASDVIHDYIDSYSSVVRVLNYKNEKVLDDFKDKVLSTDNPFVKDIVFK
jgi:predicted nucleotidyltransferase